MKIEIEVSELSLELFRAIQTEQRRLGVPEFSSLAAVLASCAAGGIKKMAEVYGAQLPS